MLKLKGGGQIGWLRSAFFVTLSVDPPILGISGFLLGTHRFKPSDVVAIEPCPLGWLSAVGPGVRIRHARADVPERIIFWSSESAQQIISAIENAGFRPCGLAAKVESH